LFKINVIGSGKFIVVLLQLLIYLNIELRFKTYLKKMESDNAD